MSEKATDLYVEESLYIGIIISAVLYGIYCGVVYLSISTILSSASFTCRRRTIYVLYGIIQWVLNTVFFFSLPLIGQMMWIVKRNEYTGGPLEYYKHQYVSSNYVLLGDATQNLAILLSDALLIHRCYIILGSSPWVVILILPVLSSVATFAVFTATIPLGLLLSVGGYRAGAYKLFSNIDSAGIAIATFTNVTTTAIISFRILIIFYSVRKFVDPRSARSYTGVVAIFVESAAPCAILGIISSIPSSLSLAQPDIWGYSLFPIWSMSLALFPQLIILRIAQGSAWTHTTSEELSCATKSIVSMPCEDVRIIMSNMQSEAEGPHTTRLNAIFNTNDNGTTDLRGRSTIIMNHRNI